ncbi:hypothetical protein Desti_3730 [Desulfomonile tiedjei DSM 6799]|uniref:Uncharacterized protein n=1 Tax=Desulfomonile tiedjei (strain ATCC 49306 / DSM 6799 / DCB-1) TaxID=706587 RepID=I4C9Y3_DESTA|nr:hypothetical protein Desti_3730 [Desulfomonile tiedjei DSM 6799]
MSIYLILPRQRSPALFYDILSGADVLSVIPINPGVRFSWV